MVGWIVALSALLQFFSSVSEQMSLQSFSTVECLIALRTVELLVPALVGEFVIAQATSTYKCSWTQVAGPLINHLHLWTHLPEMTMMAENNVNDLISAYFPFHRFLVGVFSDRRSYCTMVKLKNGVKSISPLIFIENLWNYAQSCLNSSKIWDYFFVEKKMKKN